MRWSGWAGPRFDLEQGERQVRASYNPFGEVLRMVGKDNRCSMFDVRCSLRGANGVIVRQTRGPVGSGANQRSDLFGYSVFAGMRW